ncbi:hypothetical protein SCD90_15500 [Terrihabitans sp. PJ23]|uniref:Uncharacterized protein n=2 Tax=Terrihabitans rhizophilus TaxID=3092662 RepID=A0ABU4RRJ6_9HYPH|nr:hypothetical protein [Terrihabitans sp. PJ23]
MVPSDAALNWTLATVNASQAVHPGLLPDLTLLGTGVMRNKLVNREAKEALAGLRTRHLVLVKSSRHIDWTRPRLLKIGYSYDAVTRITQEARGRSLEWATGIDGLSLWPSNGVFMAFMCLQMGAPFVLITGFSFSQSGHGYNSKARERSHVAQDKQSLSAALARGHRIYTNSTAFSDESGVPLLTGGNRPDHDLCQVSFPTSSGRMQEEQALLDNFTAFGTR